MVGDIRAFYLSLIFSIIMGAGYIYITYENVIFHGSQHALEINKKKAKLAQLSKKNEIKLIPLSEVRTALLNFDKIFLSDILVGDIDRKKSFGFGSISGDIMAVINDALKLQESWPIKYTTIEYDGREAKMDFEYYGTK